MNQAKPLEQETRPCILDRYAFDRTGVSRWIRRCQRLRLKKLESFARLRAAGCSEAGALEQLQISRRTLARGGLQALAFLLRSVQVDGDSEFMADFEQACQDLDIPLHVLPPKRPQYNGCVERANRSARIEFWSLYDGPLRVEPVQAALADYAFFYNYQRPQAALDWKTPNEYLVQREAA